MPCAKRMAPMTVRHFRCSAKGGIEWRLPPSSEIAMYAIAADAARAFPSRLRAVAGLPLRAAEAFLAWRRHREGVRLLLELDDRLLRDAGFIRRELERLR